MPSIKSQARKKNRVNRPQPVSLDRGSANKLCCFEAQNDDRAASQRRVAAIATLPPSKLEMALKFLLKGMIASKSANANENHSRCICLSYGQQDYRHKKAWLLLSIKVLLFFPWAFRRGLVPRDRIELPTRGFSVDNNL